MGKESIGLSGEYKVAIILESYGRHVRRCAYGQRFDLLVDNKYQVEVKTAKPTQSNRQLAWKFNIHRHGIMPEFTPDCFLFRLEDIPYSSSAVHMLFRSPITVTVVGIGIRRLINQQYHKEVEDFYAFANGKLELDLLWRKG